jgi:hypothetical protein
MPTNRGAGKAFGRRNTAINRLLTVGRFPAFIKQQQGIGKVAETLP